MPDTPANSAPTKSVFTSKTAIINVVIALGAAYPPVGRWVQANPQVTLMAVGALNVVLRSVTHHRLTLFNS